MRHKDIIGFIWFFIVQPLFFFVGIGIFVYGLVTNWPTERTVKYDCSMSEFHPDYPVKVKEECRKLRQENIK
jgi:uncharacterized membrane protein